MADVAVLIRTIDDQTVPAPIDGVLVRVFDADDTFVTSGVTGVLTPGEIEFSLPGDVAGTPYILRLFKAGVSFLPQPRVDIVVHDVPPAVTEVIGHVGDSSVVATLVSTDNQVTPAPLPGTVFKVYTELDSYITDLVSDAQGEAEIALEAARYIIRMLNPGWTFLHGPTQMVEVLNPLPVGGTNVFDFPAEQPEMPQSSDPNLCLLSGYFVDVAMRPLPRMRIRFMPIITDPDYKMSGFPGAGDPAVVARRQILNEALFETDEDGYVEVLLPRASCYNVHIYGYELPSAAIYGQIYVPEAAGAYLEDVLFPYPASVVFDPTSLALAVGEAKLVTPTITGSNTQELDGQYDQLFMDFTVADPLVASVSVASDGSLEVKGLAAGTTTLTASRSSTKTTFVTRRPEIPALVVTPVTITVS